MKMIIFIGTQKSGSSYEALKAAQNMGYYTVLLTNQETVISKRAEFPHINLMKYCDIDNINWIRKTVRCLLAKGADIRAIVSFIDPHCHTAAVLSHEFGLKSFSEEAISVMLDKIKSREALKGSPYAPFFREIRDEKMPEMTAKFPLVLKVPASAGSKDVHKVETWRQFEKAYHEIRKVYPRGPVLAEEYLEGPQYLVETLTANRKTHIAAIVEQEITFTGRFIVTGYKMILDHENEFFQSLKEAVSRIINRLDMKDGPCHLEIRYVGHEWKLIEANPRISGGAMNLFIETAYGVSLVKETLKLALGFEPDLRHKHEKESFLQYVIVPREGVLIKATGKNMALACPGVEHVHIRPKKGSIIMPPLSMAFRYAYVIATGLSANEAAAKAKYGASKIKFHIKEIDAYTFNRLGNAEKRFLDIADENKNDLDKTDAFFDNYILYHRANAEMA